jgi:outer membrane protein assembly factor BamB
MENNMQFTTGLVLLAGLITSASGDLAWQIKGQLAEDAWHRLYQWESQDTGSQLARINSRTGQAFWTLKDQPFVDFNKDCVDEDRLYVLNADTVQAIDVEQGFVLWTSQVSPDFVQSAGSLICYPASAQIFLSYSLDQGDHHGLAALRKENGSVLWTYASPQTIETLGADRDRVYVSGMEGNRKLTRALDQKQGQEIWTRDDTNVFYQFDAWQRLLRLDQHDIQRVDGRSGKDLWRASLPGSYLSSRSLKDAVYLQSDRAIARVNPDTGVHEWEFHFEPTGASLSSLQILANGDVLVRETRDPLNQTHFQLLQAKSGATLWEKTILGHDTVITEDKSGHLFEQTPSTLSLLNRKGQVLWNFTVPLMKGIAPKIGAVFGTDQHLFITLLETNSTYPPMTLAALDWKTGTLKWLHQAGEPLTLISTEQPALIVLNHLLTDRSFALYP